MLESTASSVIPYGIPNAPWAFIAVMGVTGAGKSTFIKTVSGIDEIAIGHHLESCTSEITGFTFHYNGYNINLIDTPGFNDTYRSETEVLQDIAGWLKTSYEKHTMLNGILYLHSINNVRMEGSALRNLRMFRQLCGEEPLKNVVLATTFWGNVDQQSAIDREHELQTGREFWAPMIQRGSRIARFTDQSSGLKIIADMLDMGPITLKIQRELVEQSKPLIETGAGQAVHEELVRIEKRHKQELDQLQDEIQKALQQKDRELQEILEESQKKLNLDLHRVQRQQEQLRSERRAERRQLQNEFDLRLREVEFQHQQDRAYLEERLESRRSTRDIQDIQEMGFDDLVCLIRRNEIKIKPEERDVVERFIQKVEMKSDRGSGKKRRGKEAARFLLKGLSLVLPVATMTLLGVPISFPFASLLGESEDQ